MVDGGPFHDGEVAVQERTGERAIAIRHGALVRDTIMPSARAFLASSRTLAVAAADDRGRPWAALWIGAPGFARSDDGRSVRISHHPRVASGDDPVPPLLRAGAEVGLLAIDLETRRRLRVNGAVSERDDEGLRVEVHEAFPNCPKYIQRRALRETQHSRIAEPAHSGSILDDERVGFVGRVDTLFVASRHPKRGMDVSHRGGEPGFVRVVDERTLRFPDYPGNAMFCTLGNFEVEPRAGVIMIDFERFRFLSFTGEVTVSYRGEDPAHPTGGTGRYWDLRLEQWIELSIESEIGAPFIDASPFNPPPFNGTPSGADL